MSAATSKRLEVIEATIAKRPDDPFAHYARGMELRSLGHLADALTALDDVASKFPKYVPTYLMAAQTAAELGEPDRARSWAERGLVQAKNAGDAHAASELASFVQTL